MNHGLGLVESLPGRYLIHMRTGVVEVRCGLIHQRAEPVNGYAGIHYPVSMSHEQIHTKSLTSSGRVGIFFALITSIHRKKVQPITI
jgi:hypothetical protein